MTYICFGDTLFFDHAGDFDLAGDPDPLSPPGIVYGLYSCPPTVTGPDLNTILLTEGCTIDMPDPGPESINVVPTSNFNAVGDGFVVNQGGFQNSINGGDPVELFITSVTVDDFIPGSPTWESDGIGGLAGPCIHANVDEAFSITFLNQIELLGLNNNAGGNGCTGTAIVTGGLPQVNNTNYVIDIFLTSDPSVLGHSANRTNTTHNELFTFDVPAPGDYTIQITDPNGCTNNFPVTMGSCQPVTLEMGDSTAAPGSLFCMPITVQDYDNITSLQLTISWDNSVMTFNSIMGGNIPAGEINVGPGPMQITDSIRINAFDFLFTPRTIPDGEVAFEVCFDIIGPLGSSSFIRIEDNENVEITGDISVPNNRVGYIFNDGSVVVTDGSLLITVSTICASANAPVEGGFNFSAMGGTAPYDYTYEQVGMPMNNGSGTLLTDGELASITNLPPGDYTINVTDDVGLTTMTTITIEQTATNFGAQLDEINPACATDTNGSVTINISGGIPPYTVIWSNGMTNTDVPGPTNTIDDLPVGNFSATVIDANGCQIGPFSTSLIVSAVSVDSISLQNVTCIGGGMDGNITVAGAGGMGPYDYSWNDPALSTTASISGLAPGNFCVTISDVNMCTDVRCFDILAPSSPTIDGFDVTEVECPNDLTGEITVNVTPGNAPIADYAWNTGDITPTISNLGPGEYKVTVTAIDGCVDSSMVTLTTPAEIALTVVPTPPTCPGDSDGQIQLMLSGGTTPFSITWDDGSSEQVRFALPCDSTYFVTITGANGCDTIEQAIFLDCPPPIGVIFSDIMGVDCFNGDCNGEALATAFGGTSTTIPPVYNYTWQSGENTMNAIDSRAVQLCRGFNTIEINDNICSIVDTVFIDSPSEITLPLENIDIVNTSCQGDSDGMITVAASGGTPGYTYLWDDNITTGPTYSDLPAGQFDVTITDANFCEEVKNISVGEPELFEILIDSFQLQQVLCPGDNSGQIVVFPSGGNPGIIDYQWTDDVSFSSVAINLEAGTYSITGTDPAGCTDNIIVNLVEPDPIEFVIGEIVQPQCFGFQTVVTIDTAFGGNGPLFQFSVNNGPARPIQGATPVLGGQSALVTVFDGEGCRAEEEIIINQPAEIVVDFGDDIEIQLGETALLEPFVGSILPVDSIVYQPLTNLTCVDSSFCLDVVVAPIESQVYSLTIFDENGCSGSDDILVEIDRNRNVFVPNAFSPNGDDVNDYFRPFIGPGVANINFMRVFDRWGELVFSTDELPVFLPDDLDDSGWDGTLNGQLMNPGVYVYIIEVEFVDGISLLFRGDVTLLY